MALDDSWLQFSFLVPWNENRKKSKWRKIELVSKCCLRWADKHQRSRCEVCVHFCSPNAIQSVRRCFDFFFRVTHYQIGFELCLFLSHTHTWAVAVVCPFVLRLSNLFAFITKILFNYAQYSFGGNFSAPFLVFCTLTKAIWRHQKWREIAHHLINAKWILYGVEVGRCEHRKHVTRQKREAMMKQKTHSSLPLLLCYLLTLAFVRVYLFVPDDFDFFRRFLGFYDATILRMRFGCGCDWTDAHLKFKCLATVWSSRWMSLMRRWYMMTAQRANKKNKKKTIK